MKMLRAKFILLAMAMSWAGCGVAPDEQEADVTAESSTEAPIQVACEAGPPSNFCQNVEGKACTATANRRCYLPNYCEWFICRCTNGTWVCQ
jgi:hypothetical protein